MTIAVNQSLLEAILDSRDRNNTILVNLLRAIPEGSLDARVIEAGPSTAKLFTLMHFCEIGPVTWDVWMDKEAEHAPRLRDREQRAANAF